MKKYEETRRKRKRYRRARKCFIRCGILCYILVSVFLIAETRQKTASSANTVTPIKAKKIDFNLVSSLASTEDYNTVKEEINVNTAELILSHLRENLPVSVEIAAEEILQLPELPTGCESVSLTMALQSLGYSLGKTTIADEYLVYEAENFAIGYVGDPKSERGAGVFGPGLTKTANLFFEKNGNQYQAVDLTGIEFTDVYAYLAAGYPVVIWTTMYFTEPNFTDIIVEYEGKTYAWYSNEHCVLLRGYNLEENTVNILDPLQGEVTVNLDTIQEIFEKTGKNAITCIDKGIEQVVK